MLVYFSFAVSVTESPDPVSGWPVSAWPIGNQMNYTSLCSSISSCPTCLHTTFNCVWCGHSCQYAKCKEGFSKGFPSLHTSLVQCQVADANSCRLLHRLITMALLGHVIQIVYCNPSPCALIIRRLLTFAPVAPNI